MEISDLGVNLIKSFEAFSAFPYNDGYGIITIGYGSTYYPNGNKVKLTDSSITETKALLMLHYFIVKIEHWIIENIKCTLNQNQFDACCSFFYNVGTEGFINNNPNTWNDIKNKNLDSFAEDILKFIHAGGKISNGLKKRRQIEYNLFKKVI